MSSNQQKKVVPNNIQTINSIDENNDLNTTTINTQNNNINPMNTIESIDEEKWAFVVWNKSIQSKSRDRVLFAIEAEYCSLKCGYADYLE